MLDTYIYKLDKTIYYLDLDVIKDVVKLLQYARDNDKLVFVFGNGGSSSTASHFVNDLNKSHSTPVKAICLNDNMPLITAWANDEDYSKVFVKQLINFASPGDVVIGISTSGNSKNVLEAIRVAEELGAFTVGFTGNVGGKLVDMVDYCIKVPNNDICIQEDVHLMLCHMINKAIEEEL